jgi:hypothetical protein
MRLSLLYSLPDGVARDDEHTIVRLSEQVDGLTLQFDAPSHGDPHPDAPSGRVDRLWEHEVVEVFVAGPGDPVPYVEVEVGPRGHWLALTLRGVRQPADWNVPLDVTWEPASNGRWRATAHLSASYLPPKPWRVNATAIHGVGAERRYLSAVPLPGPPDFHQPDRFLPFDDPND